VYNGVAIEDLGKPVIVLANKGFVNDARSAASSKGMPTLRVQPETVACESTVQADIESGIEGAMDGILAGLTKPLSKEERSPTSEVRKEPRIAFKGNYQEVNRYYYTRGWTDGLPIVPPTQAAVDEMLKGTDLAPDYVVGKVIPRLGKATVEKIAINAVMAGALPTHMPVLIAVVQALVDQKTRFDTFEVSTGSWAPFVAINGPVRNDINLNCSSGALSPGDIANASIGRAVGLVVKNVGGARKGIEDMGVLGNPGKYTLVLGEDEEESPWAPQQVDRGFKKEDSTVTIFFPNGYIQSVPRGTDAKGILDSIASAGPGRMNCLVLIPSHAAILDSEGWTKEKVKEYLMRRPNARGGEAQIGQPPPPASNAPDSLMVLVAGGPGAWFGLHKSVGGFGNEFVIRKIELPKNWKTLVAKYKDIVPNYESY